MARAKKGSDKKPVTGSTAVGWTFWSSWLRCRREWFLRYVMGLQLKVTPDYFVVGAIYHMLHEGIPPHRIKALGSEYVQHFAVAEEAFKARTAMLAPPMPKATAVEREVVAEVGGAPYSCRLDRQETTDTAREFKTAATMHANDHDAFQVHGEVLGQLITANLRQVTVDIVSKANGEVKQIQVELTPAKRAAFEAMLANAHEELEIASTQYDKGATVDRAFPPRLTSCVGWQRCLFYDHCWGDWKKKADYTVNTANFRWKEHMKNLPIEGKRK